MIQFMLAGAASVDITSDNQDEAYGWGYGDGYGAGAASVDITSDNQAGRCCLCRWCCISRHYFR